jgi:hypothetical protein
MKTQTFPTTICVYTYQLGSYMLRKPAGLQGYKRSERLAYSTDDYNNLQLSKLNIRIFLTLITSSTPACFNRAFADLADELLPFNAAMTVYQVS